MHLQIFPFDQLLAIKQLVFKSDREDGDRILDVSNFQEVAYSDLKNPLVYVTYGQSNATNSGQLGYESTGDVYMSYDGRVYRYQDPSLGGTGFHASVWGRVGDLLSRRMNNRSIVFVNAAWGGATLEELTHQKQYDFFEQQFTSALEVFGRIDGVLFHQGENDHARYKRSTDYESTFLELLGKINALQVTPVYLSQASICDSPVDQDLLNTQNKIIMDQDGVLRGPNTDTLTDPKYRLPDNCHFSSAGLDEMARMWVAAILNSSEE